MSRTIIFQISDNSGREIDLTVTLTGTNEKIAQVTGDSINVTIDLSLRLSDQSGWSQIPFNTVREYLTVERSRYLRVQSEPIASFPDRTPYTSPPPPPQPVNRTGTSQSRAAAGRGGGGEAAGGGTSNSGRTNANARRAGPARAAASAVVTNTNSWAQKKVVSLGTLIMAFVAKPLSELRDSDNKPRFEEVQVLFYNFNNKASHMSHCNVSEFPVQTKYFAREYARLRQENISRAVNLSVSEFMSFLATRIVDDVMSPAYGIADLYKTNADEVTIAADLSKSNPDVIDPQTAKKRRLSNRDVFDAIMLSRMRANNITGHSDFVMPMLSFDFQALKTIDNNSTSIKTILRIHVFDRANSPTTPLRELLSLGTNNLMSALSSFPGDPVTAQSRYENAGDQPQRNLLLESWRSLQTTMVERAKREGLIEEIPENQYSLYNNQIYRFIGGPQRLKQYVMKNVPHIIYGAMGTNVKSANLSSGTDALLNSMNMQRSLNADPVLPNGGQVGGVPLSLYPVELSVTTVGCPLLRSRGQEIFIDFNTNTTADHIYVVNGFQHKIEPGTFETSIKLIPVDTYGQYRNLIGQLNTANTTIGNLTNNQNNPNNNQQPSTTSAPNRR